MERERDRQTTLLTDKAVQFATAETCVFSDPVLCLGGISPELVKLGKVRSNVLWNHVILEYWIGSTENRWNSSGKLTRIHYIGNSRRDSKGDD